MDWNGLIGSHLDRYEIISELGRGGSSRVYKAVDPEQRRGREVAIKVIPNDAEDRQTFVRRFESEVKIVRRLRHPNIIKIFDRGENDELVYLVMQCIAGGTLRQRLGKMLPAPEVIGYITQIAHALHHAHEKRIVHRDVKPSNVLMDETRPGHVLLTDFGIAKIQGLRGLTKSGMTMGTPEYMSPEQAEGREVDRRGDIYALGCVLYEALAGRPPFISPNPVSVLYQQVHMPLPYIRTFNPSVPVELAQVIETALMKQPVERFATAEDFARALQPFATALAAPGDDARTTAPQPVARPTPGLAPTTDGATTGPAASSIWTPAPGGTDPGRIQARLPDLTDVPTQPSPIVRARTNTSPNMSPNGAAGSLRAAPKVTRPLRRDHLEAEGIDPDALLARVEGGTEASQRREWGRTAARMPRVTVPLGALRRGTGHASSSPKSSGKSSGRHPRGGAASWDAAGAGWAASRMPLVIGVVVAALLATVLLGWLSASALGIGGHPRAQATKSVPTPTPTPTATPAPTAVPTATPVLTPTPTFQQVLNGQAFTSFRGATVGRFADGSCSPANSASQFASGETVYVNLCTSYNVAPGPMSVVIVRNGAIVFTMASNFNLAPGSHYFFFSSYGFAPGGYDVLVTLTLSGRQAFARDLPFFAN